MSSCLLLFHVKLRTLIHLRVIDESVFIIKCFLVCCSCRKLTRRQRSLLLTYAEEETDVQGTVTGVDPSAGESFTHTVEHDSSVYADRHVETDQSVSGAPRRCQ